MSNEKIKALKTKEQKLRDELKKVEAEIEAIEHSKTNLVFSKHQTTISLASFLHSHYTEFEKEFSDNWYTIFHGDLIGLNKSVAQFWEYLYRNGVVDKEYIPIDFSQEFTGAVYTIVDEIHSRPYDILRKEALYPHR